MKSLLEDKKAILLSVLLLGVTLLTIYFGVSYLNNYYSNKIQMQDTTTVNKIDEKFEKNDQKLDSLQFELEKMKYEKYQDETYSEYLTRIGVTRYDSLHKKYANSKK